MFVGLFGAFIKKKKYSSSDLFESPGEECRDSVICLVTSFSLTIYL